MISVTSTKSERSARQPYAWLGVAAVTAGIGVGLAAGTAVSHADTGNPDGSGPRHGGVGTSAVVTKSASGARPRSDVAASARSAASTGARSSTASSAVSPRSRLASLPAVTQAPDLPAALPPGPDPSWSMETFLGGVKIVPGSAVKIALQDVSSARTVLNQATWGAGKPLAGLASVVPQVFLASASHDLTSWQNNIDGAKNAVADTVNVPIAHQLAQLSLLGTLLLPSMAESALFVAAQTVPLVGLFGASGAATVAGDFVADARVNSQVYRVVPFVMSKGVNEDTHISVNNGPRVPVVLDTGSSGTSITMQYVGQQGLGPSTGQGESGYGEPPAGITYKYEKYTTRIDFGGGVVTGRTTVNIVTKDTEQGYNTYQYPDGLVGVFGQAANRGAGPNNLVTLPGELKDGALMLQGKYFGVMVLGPNPLPVRASVPGVPDAWTQVRINDGPLQLAKGLIDSGGVWGDIPSSLLGQTGGTLPVGTKISVYTGDGASLLYSYTITKTNAPTVSSGDVFNTGDVPFQLGPIYVDYSQKDGIGTTAFDYL